MTDENSEAEVLRIKRRQYGDLTRVRKDRSLRDRHLIPEDQPHFRALQLEIIRSTQRIVNTLWVILVVLPLTLFLVFWIISEL